MLPPPPTPQPLLVAIVDLLGYKGHLYSPDRTLLDGGVTGLYEKYTLLLVAVRDATRISFHELSEAGQLKAVRAQINHLIASDSVMLWASIEQRDHLVCAIASLVNLGVMFGVPLRGAIAFGECIFQLEKRILIGHPIVDAVEAERCQNWIGVGVLPEAAAHLSSVPGVVDYPVPLKRSTCKDTSSLPVMRKAVAWHWSDDDPNAPAIRLRRLAEASCNTDRQKYNHALDFVNAINPPETASSTDPG
jgi:hypothetical protein